MAVNQTMIEIENQKTELLRQLWEVHRRCDSHASLEVINDYVHNNILPLLLEYQKKGFDFSIFHH